MALWGVAIQAGSPTKRSPRSPRSPLYTMEETIRSPAINKPHEDCRGSWLLPWPHFAGEKTEASRSGMICPKPQEGGADRPGAGDAPPPFRSKTEGPQPPCHCLSFHPHKVPSPQFPLPPGAPLTGAVP